MNIIPMPIAASRRSASSATIMATPRWDFRRFMISMFVTSVVYQTCHAGHGYLNAFVSVSVLGHTLGGYSDLHAFDFRQGCGVSDRSRQVNRRPLIVVRGKNWR